uniref:ATP synthase subunit delta, chloroplastic n=1 Tax=Lophocladia kuetzingii TaxID=675577 RepID=A0A1Z1MNF2_9FLOR|nr:ATP synthase CF1 subunit delta [Lophocladia kuetzingii]ARW67630.1 ATP synthase CF1 subunit delta [Lophocladia kuetzingii]
MSNQNIRDKIAVPYAEALLEIAQNVNILSETRNNLSSISTILSKSKDLQLFLSNPLINATTKKELLRTLFDDQINSFIMNFLLVLVDRRRISFLTLIIEKYLELTYRLESTTVAELSVASELSELQYQNLMEKIKFITKSNNIKLETNVDPSLIGGFIIKIGSKIIDASLAGKLKQISLYLNAKS